MKHMWVVKTLSLDSRTTGIRFSTNFFKTREEARKFKHFMKPAVDKDLVKVTIHRSFVSPSGDIGITGFVEY